MDLIDNRAATFISLLLVLVIPSIITGLQISQSNVSTVLRNYPAIMITFSVFFYVFVGLIPYWAVRMNPSIKIDWFVSIILLYLLWGTILYTFGQVLWSYVVLIILIIMSIFPFRAIFKQTHPAFATLYLIAFLWLIYLFIVQSIALFNGQY